MDGWRKAQGSKNGTTNGATESVSTTSSEHQPASSPCTHSFANLLSNDVYAAPNNISQPTNRHNYRLHSKASFCLQRFLVSCGSRKWCRQRWRQTKNTTTRGRRTSKTCGRHQNAGIAKGGEDGRRQRRKRGRLVQGHNFGGLLCLHGGGGLYPLSGHEAFQAFERTRRGADSCANSTGGVYEFGIERCWQGSDVGL